MNDSNRIVAIGLLTAMDLERLGPGFQRVYVVGDDHVFEDLIGALDKIPWLLGPNEGSETDTPHAGSADL